MVLILGVLRLLKTYDAVERVLADKNGNHRYEKPPFLSKQPECSKGKIGKHHEWIHQAEDAKLPVFVRIDDWREIGKCEQHRCHYI